MNINIMKIKLFPKYILYEFEFEDESKQTCFGVFLFTIAQTSMTQNFLNRLKTSIVITMETTTDIQTKYNRDNHKAQQR